jgi:hypothetical protein
MIEFSIPYARVEMSDYFHIETRNRYTTARDVVDEAYAKVHCI